MIRKIFAKALEVDGLREFDFEEYSSFINDTAKEPVLIVASPGMDIEGRIRHWNKNDASIRS